MLVAAGPVCEQAILDTFDSIIEDLAWRELIEVLEKIGTKKSLPLLESLIDDKKLKYPVQRALDAVRAGL